MIIFILEIKDGEDGEVHEKLVQIRKRSFGKIMDILHSKRLSLHVAFQLKNNKKVKNEKYNCLNKMKRRDLFKEIQ